MNYNYEQYVTRACSRSIVRRQGMRGHCVCVTCHFVHEYEWIWIPENVFNKILFEWHCMMPPRAQFEFQTETKMDFAFHSPARKNVLINDMSPDRRKGACQLLYSIALNA